MYILHIIATAAAVYFAKEAYDDHRIEWAMFWSLLIGWDLHTMLSYI